MESVVRFPSRHSFSFHARSIPPLAAIPWEASHTSSSSRRVSRYDTLFFIIATPQEMVFLNRAPGIMRWNPPRTSWLDIRFGTNSTVLLFVVLPALGAMAGTIKAAPPIHLAAQGIRRVFMFHVPRPDTTLTPLRHKLRAMCTLLLRARKRAPLVIPHHLAASDHRPRRHERGGKVGCDQGRGA